MSELSQTRSSPDPEIYETWQRHIDEDDLVIDWGFLAKSSIDAGFPQDIVNIAIEVGKRRNTYQAFL